MGGCLLHRFPVFAAHKLCLIEMFFFLSSVPAKPIITRATVNAAELEQLIEEFSVFKSDTASELMRRNYARRQQEQRRKMLAKLEDDSLQADSQVR